MKFEKIIIVMCSFLLVAGCGTRSNSDSVFRENYQTPEVSLKNYKSPELRPGSHLSDTAVAVAISGGGHRAGNFGIGVLKSLEELQCNNKKYNVLNEIDYFSTVSGGGISAGVYISTVFDHLSKNKSTDNYSLSNIIENNENLRDNLRRSYHDVLTSALVSLGSLFMNDRGDYLEKEFDKKLLGAENRRSLVLGDIFISKNREEMPSLPIWLANATIYENGSIFPFYQDTFFNYNIHKYTHYLEKVEVSPSGYRNIPLSIGLKASASFPAAVPATTFFSSYDKANPYLHLFDGGLADNLGTTTAIKVLEEAQQKNKVLIVIDAYNGETEPFSSGEGSPVIYQISKRSLTISLDSSRIRHRWLLNHLAKNNNKINLIYLSFDELPTDLRKEVRNIGTDFNIEVDEQGLLFSAGEKIVSNNKNVIVNTIFLEKCE